MSKENKIVIGFNNIKNVVKDNINVIKTKTENKKNSKKEVVFKNVESLQQVVNVLNEASQALNDSKRTIKESAIPEVLAGALGAGIGGTLSFATLYGIGAVGLSAAGITSGLAGAGALVGGRNGSWNICFGCTYCCFSRSRYFYSFSIKK